MSIEPESKHVPNILSIALRSHAVVSFLVVALGPLANDCFLRYHAAEQRVTLFPDTLPL